MENLYFEDVHRAGKGYPYIEPKTANLSYVVHFHDEVEICCVRRGETTVVCETGSIYAGQGDICLFMPGELHGFVSRGENSIFVMKAEPVRAQGQAEYTDLFKIRLKKNVITPKDRAYQKLLFFINKIETEHIERAPGFEYVVNALAASVCARALRDVGFHAVTRKQTAQIADSVKLLRHTERLVEKNYMNAITLDEMAEYCNFSKYYFSHYFKKVTGLSFFHYLAAYRLERAVERLKTTKDSMTEIALACGFGSSRSFNRMFKQHFGQTPTEYRNS